MQHISKSLGWTLNLGMVASHNSLYPCEQQAFRSILCLTCDIFFRRSWATIVKRDVLSLTPDPP